jgi:hypothetical protein
VTTVGAGHPGSWFPTESDHAVSPDRRAAADDTDGAGWTFETAWNAVAPTVFARLTRPLEHHRGHYRCMLGLGRMEPDCHDDYLDAVTAVVEDLLRDGQRIPFDALPGWLAPRIKSTVIDAHRRRRGERGALQRPRQPRWLTEALGGDAWLSKLAIDILTWVGVPTTVSGGIWPLGTWADSRMHVRGDPRPDERAVAADVEIVLAAMRTRPEWYESYVERPLGRKVAAVAPHSDVDSPLVIDYVADAELLSLAEEAIDAMTVRIKQGEDPRSVVLEVLTDCFNSDDVSAANLDVEQTGERVAVLLAQPCSRERLVDEVLDVIDQP